MMDTRSTSVIRDIWIRTTLEKAWNALTDPAELNRWNTRSCSIDFRVGGRAEFDYGWGVRSSGTFIEIIDLEKFVLKDDEDDSVSITSLVPENGGVRVSIEYRGLWVGDQGHAIRDNMGFGTYQFMRNLKSIIEFGKDLRGELWRSWVGINHTSIRPDHAEKYTVDKGTLVLTVKQESPAGRAGLLAGDVIIEANGQTVSCFDDFESVVGALHPEERLSLKTWRDGNVRDLAIQVMQYPVPYLA